MALNTGLSLRSNSPAGSGGSPNRRGRSLKLQDEPYTKDKAFRRYAAGVDRALALFDTAIEEWADYISFLGRLLKALQGHPEGIPVVPSKYIVGKRLAQCLHPSLPSGVHQKALEVYNFVFEVIGKDGLAKDLGIYLPGIASTLTFASISVRPLFLSLIEDHILKVPTTALRPALKALILALLPGLEEESSDEFERTLRILNQLKLVFESTGIGEVFWQNLFLASITSSSRRQGVLVYLNRYLPKLGKAEAGSITPGKEENFKDADIASVTTPEPGLLLRCFATGLTDQQVLVQRGFLDLLVTHLPLHTPIFYNQVVFDDHELLMASAVSVVLRRDMSLNRRLWSWFLGPELARKGKDENTQTSPNELSQADHLNVVDYSHEPSYFHKYGAQPLIKSLEAMVKYESPEPSSVSRPFRIALSLMDRWEIGGPVVNAIFLPLLRSLRAFQRNATSSQDFADAFRSANVFFDGVESSLIWSKLLSLVLSSDKAKEDMLRDLDLAVFVVTNFNVREEEMTALHIPLVSLAMLESLFQSDKSAQGQESSPIDLEVQSIMFHLLGLLIDMVSERAFTPLGSTPSKEPGVCQMNEESDDIRTKIRLFYEQNQDAIELSEPPFNPETLGKSFLQMAISMVLIQINNDAHGGDLSLRVQILSLILGKLTNYDVLESSVLIKVLEHRLAVETHPAGSIPFAFVSSATALFVSFYSQRSRNQLNRSFEAAAIAPKLVRHLWYYLSSLSPQYHVEAVHLLEDLQNLVWQEDLVTSTILELVVEPNTGRYDLYQPRRDDLERFATLWAYSRAKLKVIEAQPDAQSELSGSSSNGNEVHSRATLSRMLSHSMVSVLSVLRGPQTEVYVSCRDWLQGLPDLTSIFEAVIIPIKKSLALDADGSTSIDGVERGIELMEILYQLMAIQSKEQWVIFSNQPSSSSQPRSSSQVQGPDIETLQMVVTGLCCEILQRYELNGQAAANERILHLLQATLNPIRQLFSKSDNEALLQFGIDGTIVAQLVRPVVLQSRLLQSCFLDTLLLILKAKITIRRSGQAAAETTSEDSILETRTKLNNMSPRSSTSKLPELDRAPVGQTAAPQQLLNCLLKGVVNPSCQALLQKWIQLVCESTCLHALSSFSTLMKIVECFCKQIEVCFDGVRVQYQRQSPVGNNFEFPLFHLLNGLDFVLAQAHEQLLSEEETSSTTKSPEPQQGFFGSLVSGTTTSEAKPVLRNRNNNRLTVILCFQDALRICFQLWSWQSLDTTESSDTVASFQHTSQKVRTRSRRILEHLLAAEPLESMETLADIWMKANSENDVVKAAFLLNLVNTLEGTRPRITVGAIFNAISIRTYPSALMLSYRATLSSNLQEIDLLTFVNSYVQSLEDDVLDEIWKDCTTFLREVFNNPMAHRQILIQLVDFIAILSAKIENTNFGEEWKMRRELADLFVRLLTAIFTIKPQNSPREKISRSSTQAVSSSSVDSVEHVLDRNFATFSHLLGESDRLVGVMVNVVSNVIAPVLRSRQFPQNLNSSILGLLVSISRIPNSSKAWKKELTDAFNDAKFFSMMPIDSQAWLPLIHQLVVAEKDVLPELLFRFSAPTAAGIMFNIGVTAARLEADKKAQINLRRVASVLLAVGSDTFATHLGLLQAKLEELLTASYTSSPSSATRADVYMVLRALVLKSSSFGQMATFWPMLNAELRAAFTSIETDDDVPLANTYNEYSLLQAAKLLDVLLLTNREDFQPQEWLFVTDTVDAIYRPEDWDSSALIDEVGRSMMENSTADATVSATHPPLFTNAPPSSSSNEHQNLRKPWLSGEQTRSVPKADIQDVLLRPFFGQLSIHIYERTYSLDEPDMEACKVDLWADLFDERTIVGA